MMPIRRQICSLVIVAIVLGLCCRQVGSTQYSTTSIFTSPSSSRRSRQLQHDQLSIHQHDNSVRIPASLRSLHRRESVPCPQQQQQQKQRRASIATLASLSRKLEHRRIPLASAPVAPVLQPLSYYWRVALAGGLAGATGTSALYPIDSAKTLRQSNPSMYSSVRHALRSLIRSENRWHIAKAYRGIIPAAVGAIPSSALYFGAYESVKTTLQRNVGGDIDTAPLVQRLGIHCVSAACGNIISSAIFVPKEFLKQQLQYHSSNKNLMSTFVDVVQDKGVQGLYSGYRATLMRNIPSAMLRFVVYEELKRQLGRYDSGNEKGGISKQKRIGLFAAGAVAGALSSGMMTPIDVIKTRLATGTCPIGVKSCLLHVINEVGFTGLWAGAESRILFSGAFSAIGFGTFELVKEMLGVGDEQMKAKAAMEKKNTKRSRK